MPPADRTAPAPLRAAFDAAARALRSGDRPGAAAALARLALAGHRDADLHYNCAVLAGALGDAALEERFYRAALAANPDDAAALNNLGNLLRRAGRPEEALAHFDRAIAAGGREPFLFHNRGLVVQALGRPEAALADQTRAVELKPDYADAWCERGNALASLDCFAAALVSYERAAALEPSAARYLALCGVALMALGRFEEALARQRRAAALAPDAAVVRRDMGLALEQLGRPDEAAECYARALALDPELDYLAGELVNARLHACDWRDYAASVARLEAGVAAGARVVGPFKFIAVSDDPALQLACARTFAADKHPPAAAPPWKPGARRAGPIRIAYLSADFHQHATAALAAGVFEAHDRREFEITAISFGPAANDAMRARLVRAFDRFEEVGERSDREIAALVRERGIDIAVDLKGYTKDYRAGIFALRPAPVQASFLGYPGTMGAGYIDYIVADRTVIPAHRRDAFAEQVVYLPDSYQPNDSKRALPEDGPTRTGAGLPDTGFVFCSFNQHYKIVPPVYDRWMRLLGAVAGSVLWLLEGNAAAVRNLRAAAAERGIAPGRLVFAPRAAPEAHLARQRLADLFLDTLPVNAHTTAADALWMGLPVLTCAGEAFAGRVAASLLHAIGAPELVTHDLDAYERLALALARDPARLAALRARIVANRRTHPLFDTTRFTRHLEAAYRTMHEIACRGEAPRGFAVPAIEADSPGVAREVPSAG